MMSNLHVFSVPQPWSTVQKLGTWAQEPMHKDILSSIACKNSKEKQPECLLTLN